MKLIKRGAEAELYKTMHWKQESLLKKRVPKKYRNQLLDEKIRKKRTKQEAVLLYSAKKAGVRVPSLLKVDKKNHCIWMEWIKGNTLKEILKQKKTGNYSWIGKQIALLHEAGIVHGDLTTSNIMVNAKELVFIDFGLGFFSGKTEDQAADILNFKKTFLATHSDFPQAFGLILKAYKKNNNESKAVFRQMEKIEKRTRYS